jgi:hypothetical protein
MARVDFRRRRDELRTARDIFSGDINILIKVQRFVREMLARRRKEREKTELRSSVSVLSVTVRDLDKYERGLRSQWRRRFAALERREKEMDELWKVRRCERGGWLLDRSTYTRERARPVNHQWVWLTRHRV